MMTTEVKLEVEVSIEVWCDTCGAGLCGVTTPIDWKGIKIEVCDKCLKSEYERGYADALEEGEST